MPDDAERRPPFANLELIRNVSRLTHRRYRNAHRIGCAHRLLRDYAECRGIPEPWCDLVLLEYLEHDADVAA